VTLLITLFLVTLVLFALFLGGSLVAQGYLYQEPADRLPLRALAGAILVGTFITVWVMIDRGSPRKYDTFFEFSPYETKEFSDFEAIRWVSLGDGKLKLDASGHPVEVVVKFKRGTGTKANTFVEEGSGDPFMLNSSGRGGESYMTTAIRAKAGPDAEAVRFDAQLKETRPGVKTYAAGPEGRTFVEQRGSRYIQADQLGVVYVPSTGAIILALLINLLHFVVWFIVFWPILQFTRGHAFLLMTVFALVTMLLLMPLLFERNRPKKPGPEVPRTVFQERGDPRHVRAQETGGSHQLVSIRLPPASCFPSQTTSSCIPPRQPPSHPRGVLPT